MMVLQREDINKIIKYHIKSKEFEFLSCKNVDSQDISMGFLSSQGKKCIKFTTGEVQELYIFVKQLPQSEYQRNNIIEMGCFQRESLVYEKILADFIEYPIPIPKCYLTKPGGIVVLEDLTQRGYRNRSLYEPLDLPHCEKALETLAKFHAASFIIERREGSKLNRIYPEIGTEVLINADHSGKRSVLAGVKSLKKVVEKYLSSYPNEVAIKIFDYIENIFDKLKSSVIHLNALSHSDLWGNNIMYKYGSKGILLDAFIIDLQFVSYKPPTHDIQFFLHTCTTKPFRERHYRQLMEHYFNCLSKQLMQSGIDLSDMMSWSDFEGMQAETLPNVLAITAVYLSFVMMPPGIIKDVIENDDKFKVYYEVDRNEYVLRAMEEDDNFYNRNIQCLTDLFDYFV